jgi:site-specific DNA-methyltransferase (cytosine-N4-specific)
MQDDGWYLRGDYIWHKPNPMPESVTDRCTKSHEYIFHFSKSERYFWDSKAIQTPFSEETKAQSFDTMNFKARDRYKRPDGWDTGKGGHGAFHRSGREKGGMAPDDYVPPNGANRRSVWTIATSPFPDAHFATFPPDLPEICIKAGCPPDGTVLDPFGGAGTTGLVADRLQRNAILIELNPTYAAMAEKRINGDRGALLDMMETAE